ncbi:MAG: hypothetical protein PHP54_01745 [Clostridia bacterium]|nr:hypothetical protein [Clostridia bacterium]
MEYIDKAKALYDSNCLQVKVPPVIDKEYIEDRNRNNNNTAHDKQYSWEFCGQDLRNVDMGHLTLDDFKEFTSIVKKTSKEGNDIGRELDIDETMIQVRKMKDYDIR